MTPKNIRAHANRMGGNGISKEKNWLDRQRPNPGDLLDDLYSKVFPNLCPRYLFARFPRVCKLEAFTL